MSVHTLKIYLCRFLNAHIFFLLREQHAFHLTEGNKEMVFDKAAKCNKNLCDEDCRIEHYFNRKNEKRLKSDI